LPVRNLIEKLANNMIENGLRTGTYNKRGVVTRGLTDGGKHEYARRATTGSVSILCSRLA